RLRRLFVEQLEDRRLLTTVTWNGGDALSDQWSDPDNWLGGLVPVTGDDVLIPVTAGSAEVLFDGTAAAVTLNSLTSDEPFHITGSTLTLSGAGMFKMTAGLTLDSGTLAGTSTLDVSGTLTWAGGTMQDAGITNANGGMTINGSDKILSARTLNIAAGTTATWTGGNINS